MDSDHDCTATADYSCPFCGEDYDVLGLCLHIDDEHLADAKAGVQQRRRYHKGGSNSTISMLRKEFRESHIHSIYGSSVKAYNAEPDPLLLSFISAVGKVIESQPLQSSETKFNYRIIGGESSERVSKRTPVFEKEQEEAAHKSEFVQGLLLWTILGDE